MPVGVQLSIPADVPIHDLSSSPGSTLSHHTPNSPDTASSRPPTLDSTLGRPTVHVHRQIHVRRPVYAAESVRSRRTSISSDSTSDSPPHRVIPVGIPIRYSPIGTTNLPTNLPTSFSHPPSISISRSRSPIRRPQYRRPQYRRSPSISISRSQTPIRRPQYRRSPSISINRSQTPIRRLQFHHPEIHTLPHDPNNIPSSYMSGGFYEMQISILEDFRGIGMEHHRADLLKRLDHVIRQLDRGLYFKRLDPAFNEDYLQRTKHQYQYLREILLEANATSDQPYVSFNDHAAPYAHLYPRCTQDLAQHFCGSFSRTLSLTGRIPDTHTLYFIHTLATVSRPPLYTQLSIHVLLIGYNFSLDVDCICTVFCLLTDIGVHEE